MYDGAGALHLDRAQLEGRVALDRKTRHHQSICRAGHVLPALVRRLRCGHEQHAIELRGVRGEGRQPEMSEMRRVERATQDADAPRRRCRGLREERLTRQRESRRSTSRPSVVVAPLELGATDVDGRPRPGAARRSSRSTPTPLEHPPEAVARLVVLEVGAGGGRLDAAATDPQVTVGAFGTTSQPSASGSKRWTRISSGSASAAASSASARSASRRLMSASRPVPSCALTPSGVRAVRAERGAQLGPAVRRPREGRAW